MQIFIHRFFIVNLNKENWKLILWNLVAVINRFKFPYHFNFPAQVILVLLLETLLHICYIYTDTLSSAREHSRALKLSCLCYSIVRIVLQHVSQEWFYSVPTNDLPKYRQGTVCKVGHARNGSQQAI